MRRVRAEFEEEDENRNEEVSRGEDLGIVYVKERRAIHLQLAYLPKTKPLRSLRLSLQEYSPF